MELHRKNTTTNDEQQKENKDVESRLKNTYNCFTLCISYFHNMKPVILHKKVVFYVFFSSSSSHSKANFDTFLGGGEISNEELGDGLPRFAAGFL